MNNPTEKQLEFLDWELGVFMHYGIRTFNEEHRDWDMKPMTSESFNPSEQDCRQWIKSLKAAGVKYTVLTSKHHDGFCLWPTAQTEHCIRNSPYKNGKGDVIKEYVDACREFGMKCGIYYSCAQFGSAQLSGKEYENYVVAQLTELCANYGKIDYLWFDGCGSDGHNFDNDRIKSLIRELQPDVLSIGTWGDTCRWIGNEWGVTSLNNLNHYSGEDIFKPGECDCCITRNQSENFWFYNETHKDCVRTPEEMVGLYYHSIGKGANLLLNIAPDRRGLIPESNLKLLGDMTAEMKRRLVDCRLPSSEVIKDDEKYFITLDKYSLVNEVVLEEDMTDGQHITSFDICVSETFEEFNSFPIYRGYTVGHKMICTFPPIRAKNIVVKVNGTDGKDNLKNIYACYTADGEQIYQIY